jgi:hypothetical protein
VVDPSGGRSPISLDADQRARLLQAKARALVVGSPAFAPAATDDLDAVGLPGAVALTQADRGWVLLDEAPERSIGRVLAWAEQRGVQHLHLLAERASGVLARRAGLFADAPSVWRVEGRSVHPAVADEVPGPSAPPEAALDLVGTLAGAGLDIVIEHGRVGGEVLGLEVAIIVVDDDRSARIEIGVGRHDRDAFALVHGDTPAPQALAAVVETVRRHRHPGAVGHPLGRLAPERWLRSVVLERPGLVGATELEPVEPVLVRTSVKDPAAAIAAGVDVDGQPVVVACSVGIDLDLVPSAADARHRHAPGARLVLVVPRRDDHPVTRRLARRLVQPADIVTLPDDFRS